jgi:ABC-type nickel/cobalt efflux system permease component RcnA
MQRIRSIIFTVFAMLVAGVTIVFAASVGLAIVGITAVLMLGSLLAAKFQTTPVRATARARNDRATAGQREPRIWNDGRGTIIDL